MSVSGGRPRRRPSEVDVVFVGLLLVGLATGFRIWALHGAWWFFDDFYFIQRALSHDPTPSYLLTPYNGHLMPGGVLLTWVNAQIGPLDFTVAATEIVVLFAILGLGMLRLLVRLFGARWGVIPPLVVFLFSPILLPATIWWAAAVNQLPMMIALVLGLDSFIGYLREPSAKRLAANVAWMLLGLAFVERTLLGFGMLWLVALMYFCSGTLPERFHELWKRYRPAVVVHAVLVAAYVTGYASWALNFDARTVIKRPFFEVLHDLVGTAFSAGFVGGPVDWSLSRVTQNEAHPPQWVLVLGWVTLAVLIVAAAKTRTAGLRAWLLPAFSLAANIALISVSRAIYFGPEIALDYRFQTEAALAAALALGLAFLPVLGARESSAPTTSPWRVDTRGWAVVGCVVFLSLAALSTSRFPLRNLTTTSPRTYLDNVAAQSRAHPGAQLLNQETPDWMWAPLAYPTNTYRYMFAALRTDLKIRESPTDTAYLVDDTGRFRELTFAPARTIQGSGAPGADPESCPNVVTGGSDVLLLDGPVFGIGWYARLAYVAPTRQPITLEAGGHLHHLRLEAGSHTVLVPVPGAFESVRIEQRVDAQAFCLTKLEVGQVGRGSLIPDP